MKKYYKNIESKSKINTRLVGSMPAPVAFNNASSIVISQCSFLQTQIQRIVYVTHGSELLAAKKTLIEFPNPKSRIKFLTSFPYDEADFVVSKVFDYAKNLFTDIYALRNILAHEQWMLSEEYEESVLFSQISEEARLLMASGKILHKEGTTSKELYDATIRYIRSIKVITCLDLHNANKDADLCGWILMTIAHIIDEKDISKKDALRRSFLVFKGTSHLFDPISHTSETVNVQISKNKTILG